MLSMAMTGRMLTDWLGDDRLTRFGVRFVRQVWPGDTLTAAAEVEAIRVEADAQFVDVVVSTRNQAGDEVLSGYATARLDP
jgi:acyl dehydratase